MKVKETPIITHTEILARAIGSVEAEIEAWANQSSGLPVEQREAMFAAATKELAAKRDTLKTLYRIETGVEFD